MDAASYMYLRTAVHYHSEIPKTMPDVNMRVGSFFNDKDVVTVIAGKYLSGCILEDGKDNKPVTEYIVTSNAKPSPAHVSGLEEARSFAAAGLYSDNNDKAAVKCVGGCGGRFVIMYRGKVGTVSEITKTHDQQNPHCTRKMVASNSISQMKPWSLTPYNLDQLYTHRPLGAQNQTSSQTSRPL